MVFGGKFQRRESLDFRPYTGESSHHLRRGKEIREVREFLGEGFRYTIGRNVDWESFSLMAFVFSVESRRNGDWKTEKSS